MHVTATHTAIHTATLGEQEKSFSWQRKSGISPPLFCVVLTASRVTHCTLPSRRARSSLCTRLPCHRAEGQKDNGYCPTLRYAFAILFESTRFIVYTTRATVIRPRVYTILALMFLCRVFLLPSLVTPSPDHSGHQSDLKARVHASFSSRHAYHRLLQEHSHWALPPAAVEHNLFLCSSWLIHVISACYVDPCLQATLG